MRAFLSFPQAESLKENLNTVKQPDNTLRVSMSTGDCLRPLLQADHFGLSAQNSGPDGD